MYKITKMAAVTLILTAAIAGMLYAKTATTKNTVAVSTTQSLSRGSTTIESAPVKQQEAPEPKFGKLTEWSQADSIIPRGTIIKVTDLYTGKAFIIKRTYGTNHVDGEALTTADSNIIKSIWGGFSWERRPVIVKVNGQYLAASMSAMPHAGIDSADTEVMVNSRSDGYGRGVNLDAVKGNGMDGVIDIHFYKSTRHLDNKSDPKHQAAVLAASGK